MIQYWLVKSEPDECSIDDFVNKGSGAIRWDGVRNYQARNFIRMMQPGDLVRLYHSSCANIGIAGTLKVVSEAYTDPLQFDSSSAYFDVKSKPEQPRWSAVDLVFVNKAPKVLTLKQLKQIPQLAHSTLLTRPRLSVMPLTESEWGSIEKVMDGV